MYLKEWCSIKKGHTRSSARDNESTTYSSIRTVCIVHRAARLAMPHHLSLQTSLPPALPLPLPLPSPKRALSAHHRRHQYGYLADLSPAVKHPSNKPSACAAHRRASSDQGPRHTSRIYFRDEAPAHRSRKNTYLTSCLPKVPMDGQIPHLRTHPPFPYFPLQPRRWMRSRGTRLAEGSNVGTYLLTYSREACACGHGVPKQRAPRPKQQIRPLILIIPCPKTRSCTETRQSPLTVQALFRAGARGSQRAHTADAD
ncbi:hypothetical protein IQ07DRAFT_221788 [Pyrenochaeta sp. DS3sAY3a]|nr:hypothetical protein IQ07DRAFT_221788 [Pyrenochaeta sp. DS3sAY3a]